jgi:rhomboid protease GluP
MAFGITPKFEQTLELNGLDPKHYLAIALTAAKQLEWKINYTSKSGFIGYIGGGIFTTLEEITVIIQDDTVSIVSKSLGSEMMDFGKNKKHVNKFLQAFDDIQTSTTDEQLQEMVTELTPVFESEEIDRLTLPPPTTKDNFKSFLSLFIPRNGYFITPIIIDINILIFIIMSLTGVSLINPTMESLLTWGANFRPVTVEGEWWRLLSNTFLHIGIMHLLLNMYALAYIGILLEPYLGKARFTTAYLLSGILASLTSVAWHPFVVSAGASGAIFGLYGVFLAMLTTNFIDKGARKPLLTSIGIFVAYNLLNGLKGGIDNAAHIGGLLAGIIIGYAYYPSLKRTEQLNIKIITIGLLSAVFMLSAFVIGKKIPNDFVKYDALMQKFAKDEEEALYVFKLPKNEPKNQLLAQLNYGITVWTNNLGISKEIDSLDVPEDLKLRAYRLKKYCDLRLKSYRLIYKAVDEQNDTLYRDSIQLYNQQIQTSIDNLQGK